MDKILVITGGTISQEFIKKHLYENVYELIIAVDRGLAIAKDLNLNVDHIVGDFDSINKEILNEYKELPTVIHSYSPIKDETDTSIAMELALSYNPKSIMILGGLGSRFDHSLANIYLLSLALKKEVEACIIDENNKIYLKDNNFSIQKSEQYGDFVSLLPFCGEVEGLTLKGFKYSLDKAVLEKGCILGISNEIIDSKGVVEITKGALIIIESKD